MSDFPTKSLILSLIFFDSTVLRPYDGALMSNAPLPNQLDIRKLVVKGAEISVDTPVSSLPRFVDLLANDGSLININLQFYVDDERFRRVDGQINGEVEVFCQRCLEPMPLPVDIQFQLAVVWSEEDAERLPETLEPLIVGEELVDLADIVSEELILSLPFVSYHKVDDCHQPGVYSSADVGAVVTNDKQDNPFKVLENIKFDK